MIERSLFTNRHEVTQLTVRRFMEKGDRALPHDQWEKDGIVPREL